MPRPVRPETVVSTSRRPDPTTLAFHASRIVVDVGVLIVMTAMSLPFVTAPSGNRSSMLLDALPTVALLAPIFLITLIPDHTRPIPRILGWISLVLGLAAFPFAVVKYLDSVVLARTLDGSVGMGGRLLVFGTFVTLVGIAVGLTRSFLGLEAGGTPGRRAAVRTRQKPAKAGEVTEVADAVESESEPEPVRVAPQPAAPPTTRSAAPETPPAQPHVADPAHPQPRPRPARPALDENPFGEPLFDSMEIPVLPAPDRQPSLTFDGEDASERVVDDDEG